MEIRRADWQDHVFETIYFGGGTPSQLCADELRRLLAGIYRHFSISDHPEITLEANPDDLSDGYVESLRTLPVNRISIGIQSFDDRELRLLNRRHTAQEAIEAVVRCQMAGLTNISVDLMFGLPGQSTEVWSRSIDKAIALDVPHVSAYNLTCEEGTVIRQMMDDHLIRPIDDDTCAQYYQLLVSKLTSAGFVHYEISNFARCTPLYPAGQISLHNASYWNGTFYLGLGTSAHSYNGVSRSWNVSSLSQYINAIHYHSTAHDPAPAPNAPAPNAPTTHAPTSHDPGFFYETELLDERAMYNDFVITRLRTMWGISLDELRREFGKERESYFLEKSERLESINKLKKQGGNVKVLPEEIFISDAIIRELID
jgi:oxygen-independent coproporphyrinogen-3 oxidase